MRPRGKPDLKTRTKVEPLHSVLILPSIGKHPAQENKEDRYDLEEPMGMDKRQVGCLIDADDLWRSRTHDTISESRPTPPVVVQG
jgi:hypothetical protein